MYSKHYNIMTSSDENLVSQLPVLLYSISANLSDASIDFYFFCRQLSIENEELLKRYCDSLGNIEFRCVIIDDPENYDNLAFGGGGWAGEAYYSFCAHQMLPESVERIMYLDAGDVIVTGDIADFYNTDFEGKSLVVHPARFKLSPNQELVCFESRDLNDRKEGMPAISRGIFNSGSYIMNLKKMREDGLTINDYLYMAQTLYNLYGDEKKELYYGDQGLLSIVFVGDIKYYCYPEIRNLWYMPYNFCIWYYDRMNVKPDYIPSVVHFAGSFKPWCVNYPVCLRRFQKGNTLHDISELKLGQAEWYYLWHEYAMIADEKLKSLGY